MRERRRVTTRPQPSAIAPRAAKSSGASAAWAVEHAVHDAVHVLPLHSALIWTKALQSSRLSTLTYWPSQKSAPSGAWQSALQPPVSFELHPPWHWISQSRFARAWHSPSQLAWQRSWQLAEGGVAWQCALQSPSHEPLHCETHVVWSFELLQVVSQSASQLSWQRAVQLKLPGSAMHEPSQSPWQLAVQPASIVTSLRAAALRFVLSNGVVSSAVLGPRSVAQLDQLLRDAGDGPPYLRDTALAELATRLKSFGVPT